MKKRKWSYPVKWYPNEFPKVHQMYLEKVRRKATREPGAFNLALLRAFEEKLKNGDNSMSRVEKKLAEILKLLHTGVTIQQASQDLNQSSELSDEEKDRLNSILDTFR